MTLFRCAQLVTLVLLTSSCGPSTADLPPRAANSESDGTSPPSPPPLGAATTSAPPAQTSAPESQSPPPNASSTGVAECDDYFQRMTNCFAKNPAAGTAMQATMTQMREAFRAQAATAGGRDALTVQCKDHIKLLDSNPMCQENAP